MHLEGDNRIKSVTVKNTEINIIFPQVKTFRLDIRAKTANGFCINVEMQKAKPLHFVEQVLLQHSAFLLQSKYELDQETFAGQSTNLTDAECAERESRRYEIPPTFAIWICDFALQQQDDYRGTWAIRNEKGLTISDKVKYIIYDLTRFDKAENQVKTEEEQDYLAWIKMKGVDKRTREIAKKMLLKNEPIDKIIDYTELPELEVLAIKANIKSVPLKDPGFKTKA